MPGFFLQLLQIFLLLNCTTGVHVPVIAACKCKEIYDINNLSLYKMVETKVDFLLKHYLLEKTWTENVKPLDEVPQETQHAVCRVFTKEIEASAKATITRQLKGVCSSKDINTRFKQLQTTILQELQDIKKALGLPSNNYKRLISVSTSTSSPSSTTELPSYDYQDYVNSEDDIKTIKSNNVKSLDDFKVEQYRIPDDVKVNDEILIYNDTIVESGDGDLYFYYWKIAEVSKVLKKRNIYVSSPSFSVLGHTLHLQLYPNYLEEYLGILLKPSSNSFLKKHKIIFLGQTSTQNMISSTTLYGIKNKDKIFKIEPQMLDRNFIIGDSLLVKLKIYLNS